MSSHSATTLILQVRFTNPTHEMLDSTYFDSDDLSLHDHGLTLRVRHVGDKCL
jgi:inorganic triphosphatase YgiF